MKTTGKQKQQQKQLTSYFVGGPSNTTAGTSRKRPRSTPRNVSSEKFRSLHGGSSFGVCPLCQSSIAWHLLESHASACNGIILVDNDNDDQATKASHEAIGNKNLGNSTHTPPLPRSAMMMMTKPTTSELQSGETAPVKSKEPRSPSSLMSSSSSNGTPTEIPGTTGAKIVTPRFLAPVFRVKKQTKDIQTTRSEPHRSLWYEPIPGLYVLDDFLTEEEESRILRDCLDVDSKVLPQWKFGSFNGKHYGKRWGVHCNLRDRRVGAPEHPLPKSLTDTVVPKLKAMLSSLPNTKKNLIKFRPNEANAIDYRKKQGHWLQAHVDDRKLSKEPIANLSLVGDCFMTFRNVSRHRNNLVGEQRVFLKRRCLQILTGKARYDFSHAIANADLVSDRRVSITLRESPLTMVSSHSITTALR